MLHCVQCANHGGLVTHFGPMNSQNNNNHETAVSDGRFGKFSAVVQRLRMYNRNGK